MYGGTTAEDRREILRWILFDNHKFTSYLATLRYLRFFASDVDNSVDEFLEKRALKALQVADQRLTKYPFITGEQVTIADISMSGYVYFLDEARIDIADFPALGQWRERMQQLPGWGHPHDLMPKSGK